jgi:hypothetical protein
MNDYALLDALLRLLEVQTKCMDGWIEWLNAYKTVLQEFNKVLAEYETNDNIPPSHIDWKGGLEALAKFAAKEK